MTSPDLPQQDMPDPEALVIDEGVADIDESAEVIPVRYEITSYGADYPVDSLVKRVESNDIRVPTFDPDEGDDEVEGFQRGFIWSKPQCDRFIESLLLGFPVPGIFLVKQPSGVLLVLDGHQRLRTLQAFYKGVLRGRQYKLRGVQERFDGRGYEDLDPEDRRKLDDSIIHATIIRQEDPPQDQSSVYLIFERLNTGGTNLQPQEIRVALYRGRLLGLLRELNEHESWRQLYGPRSKRLKDHELILRFLAMYEMSEEYSRPMKDFLNTYMGARTDLPDGEAARLGDLFKRSTDTIMSTIGQRAFRLDRAVNAAVLDSVLVAVARRLDAGPIEDAEALEAAYTQLLGDDDYRGAVERATADEDSVRTRLRLATEALSNVS